MSLQSLFTPQSIAIIGASTRPGAVGNDVVKNTLLSGYQGRVFPINPKAEILYDLTCYPDITAVPLVVDLAIIIIPAAGVPAVLEEVAQKGVKQVVIISAGFREVGKKGTALEESVIALAKKYNLTLLGPNCLGFLHPTIGLNASFAKQMPKAGPVSFFSQSGALSTALLDMTSHSLGFSHFVSIGNKALLGESDFLQYFKDEPSTEVIGFYSEGVTDAPAFIRAGRSILTAPTPKPVVALKSGTTDAGTRASSSHTGSLAGSNAAYTALFRQARILRSENFVDLLDTLQILSHNPLPKGNRVAVITNAGGLGVLASDALVEAGLEVPALKEEIQAALRPLMPEAASVTNPVDVLGDAPALRYTDALRFVGQDTSIHMVLCVITPQSMTEATETAEALVAFKEKYSLPIAAVFAGEDSFQEAVTLLEKGNIATYRFPEAAAKALGNLFQITSWQKMSKETPFSFSDIHKEKAAEILQGAQKAKRAQLEPEEVQTLLEAYGFSFPKSGIAKTKKEALHLIKKFQFPLVLKIVSPDIIHKSDVGGVIVGVTEKTFEKSYDTLLKNISDNAPKATIEGVYIGEMAPQKGKELILGIKEEPGLGKLLMIGLGGIYVEVFRDASFRFAPLTKEDASEMLHELKSFSLLEGARGEKGVDQTSLVDALGRLSLLVTDFPEITELDINPLLTFTDATKNLALDARITLAL